MARKKLKCSRCGCRRITSGKDRRDHPLYCRLCEDVIRREMATSGYLTPKPETMVSESFEPGIEAGWTRGVKL